MKKLMGKKKKPEKGPGGPSPKKRVPVEEPEEKRKVKEPGKKPPEKF